MIEIILIIILLGILVGGYTYKDIIRMYWMIFSPILIFMAVMMFLVLMVIILV